MKLRILVPALLLFAVSFLFFSCAQPTSGEADKETVPQFSNTTITVKQSGETTLAILLADDGTINRKGSGVVDSADHYFFMGLTREPLFDSLMKSINGDLLAFCGKVHSDCDTTKANCRVTISLSGRQENTGLEYCVNGTMNDLPRPIREYISTAMRVTEPWYSQEKNLTQKK